MAIPEKAHLVVADFNNIRLGKPPKNLFFGLLRAMPEREAQIGVVGNKLPLLFSVGDRPLCSGARRLVGEAEGSEVERPRRINKG
ncbi:hypothetical protein DSECCO2_590360 [anaerobic digester metagenome]